MCAPAALAIASFALEAGGQVAGYAAKNRAARANQAAAAQALSDQVTATNSREVQQTIQEQQQQRSLQEQGLAATAMARTSAGEAGVEGASVDAVVQTIDEKRAEAQATNMANLDAEKQQNERERQSEMAGYQSRVNSVPGGNALDTALGIVGSGIGAATSYSAKMHTPNIGASNSTRSTSAGGGDPFNFRNALASLGFPQY